MSYGTDPVWEDIYIPQSMITSDDNYYTSTGKDKFNAVDVIMYKDDPYIVSNYTKSSSIYIPMHNSDSSKQQTINPNSKLCFQGTGVVSQDDWAKCYPDVPWSESLDFMDAICFRKSWSGGVPTCLAHWGNATKLVNDTTNNTYGKNYFSNNPEHQGYGFADAMYSYDTVGTSAKPRQRNINYGTLARCDDGKRCLIKGPCADDSYSCCNRENNTSGLPCSQNMNNWDGTKIKFFDNNRLFPNITCDSEQCVGSQIPQSMTNYYMPLSQQVCTNESGYRTMCVDNTNLYLNLVPEAVNPAGPNTGRSQMCKRGYSWGVLNGSTIFIGKNCAGTFTFVGGESSSSNVSCPSSITNAPNYYMPKTCSIKTMVDYNYNTNSIVNAPGYDPSTQVDCKGDPSAVKCYPNGPASGTTIGAACSNGAYVCAPGTCSANTMPTGPCYDASGKTVPPNCVSGVWSCPNQPSTNHWFIFIIIIVAVLLGGVFYYRSVHRRSL